MRALLFLILFISFSLITPTANYFYASEFREYNNYQSDYTFSILISRISEIQNKLSSPTISKGERETLERELEILTGLLSKHLDRKTQKKD